MQAELGVTHLQPKGRQGSLVASGSGQRGLGILSQSLQKKATLWRPWFRISGLQNCAVIQSLSCVQLCDPMDSSTPGFPVLHHLRSLLKLMSTESVMPSNHLILCRPLLLKPSIFPSIRVFASGGQSIGVSASASVLPMNIQD